MNAPFTPVDPHGAYDDVSALLKILADPATHKARLDELIAQEAAAREKIAELNAMAGETRQANTTAQATTIVLNNRKTALDAREAELAERAKNLELSEATRSDAALRRREAAVQTREAAVTREAERLAAIKTDLEGKHAKVKDLVGALG